jgi:hypothetical protein
VEYVVRPFDRKAPILGKDFAQRMKSSNTGGKAQFGRTVWGRRIDQKKACMKIAPWRRPNAAIAAAALGRSDNLSRPASPCFARVKASRWSK